MLINLSAASCIFADALLRNADTSTNISKQSVSKGSISYNNQTETLQFSDLITSDIVELYSLNGRLILRTKLTDSDAVSVQRYPKGNYLVRVVGGLDIPSTFKFTK